MKKSGFLNLLCFILTAAFILSSPALSAPTDTQGGGEGEFRGLWVATVINLDYPSAPGLTVAELKSEALRVLDKAAELGFNAVIFQVRPLGDALYKSDYYPWSAFLTGTQGKAPDGGFDPLTFWVDEAHKRGLELHAWVNPYRVARTAANIAGLSSGSPAVKHPEWAVTTSDGGMYLNPGLPEVRELALNGIKELVENYSIDGIHFDDYFYPGPDFNDDAAFAKYGGSDKAAWRRENVTTFIKETQAAIKAINPGCSFGIAPVGIWANKKSHPLGSDTTGYESYVSQSADTRKWVKEGLIDYIAPQIYWSIGADGSDYAKLVAWWSDTVRGTGVKLYIGHATYRLEDTSPDSPWHGTDELIRQITLNRKYPEVGGSIHFRYAFVAGSNAVQAAIKGIHDVDIAVLGSPSQITIPKSGIVMPQPDQFKLSVGRPTGDTKQTQGTFYFTGASDPSQELTVNGEVITGRTDTGFFGYFASLKMGVNVFTFIQGEKSVTRTVTRTSPPEGAAPQPMSRAEIVPASAYPNAFDELRQPGDSVTLKCTAPIGATVTVRIGGETYSMKPGTTSNPGDGKPYPTTYTYEYTLPDYTATGRAITVGTPRYTMAMDGKTTSRLATGRIKCVMPGADIYAKTVSDAAFLFPGAATKGGPQGELCGGMVDRVTSVISSGSWVRLGMGMWVQRSDVSFTTAGIDTHISSASYDINEKWETLTFKSAAAHAPKLDYTASKITVFLPMAESAPEVALPAGSLFSAALQRPLENGIEYTFTLAADKRLDGYYVSCTDNGFSVNFKRPLTLKSGAKPLEGFNIMLDPGHGEEPGAPGAWGNSYSESHINLYTGLKLKKTLESLGATVTITRTSAADISLDGRVVKSRNERPDLFLSLHCNSLEFYTDASNVRGALMMYSHTVSGQFAETIISQLEDDLSIGRRGTTKTNLYVCRPQWCPSALLEAGFMCNPQDYAQLIDNERQDKLVESVARGVLRYFT